MGSHSSTTAVCVAFLHRRTGGEGAREPKEERIVDWRLANAAEVLSSVTWLRATVMSTMDPDTMSGGRRIEGNSIYGHMC
jgi:hypothetical protein